jgi:GNAT superfamily N-acetyltransferase
LSDHAAVSRKAVSDASGAQPFVLRDGRVAIVEPARSAEKPAIERLIAEADAARSDLYAQAERQRADPPSSGSHAGAVVARDGESGELIGFITYLATGDLVGVVDPRCRGIGLGTLLLQAAAEHARKAGLQTLHVDLTAGSEETAAMLRDTALVAHWDIDYPVTRVTLELASSRPGWTTPLPRAV